MTLEGCRGHLGNKICVGDEEALWLKLPNLSPHLSLCPQWTNSPFIPMLCPEWIKCPKWQFCPERTILSPGDNILEFCHFVLCTTKPVSIGGRSSRLKTFAGIDSTCCFCFVGNYSADWYRLRSIAKFVPFYGDKFGDMAKIQFCPPNDLYNIQGSFCRVSLEIKIYENK